MVNMDALRQRCKERGITIAELERNTGISNGVIARWESSSPRVCSVQAVADFFGCTVDDLLIPETRKER